MAYHKYGVLCGCVWLWMFRSSWLMVSHGPDPDHGPETRPPDLRLCNEFPKCHVPCPSPPPLLLRLPSVARASLSLRGSLSCLAGRTGPNGGRSGVGKEARWRFDHPGTIRKCRWKGKRRSGCDVTRQISCVRLWHSVPERVSRLIVFLPLSMPETWRSGWHPPPHSSSALLHPLASPQPFSARFPPPPRPRRPSATPASMATSLSACEPPRPFLWPRASPVPWPSSSWCSQ